MMTENEFSLDMFKRVKEALPKPIKHVEMSTATFEALKDNLGSSGSTASSFKVPIYLNESVPFGEFKNIES